MATLFDTACIKLFYEIRFSGQCLNGILPPASSQCYGIRQRAHKIICFTTVSGNLYKKSVVNVYSVHGRRNASIQNHNIIKKFRILSTKNNVNMYCYTSTDAYTFDMCLMKLI